MRHKLCSIFFLLATISSFVATVAVAQDVASDAPTVAIHSGSGSFVVNGGGSYEGKQITVYYHKPENFHKDSSVLIVIPGAGRNGDDYRNAWVEASEQYGILVLSPSYPEKFYPGYWSYNLAGMTSEATFDLSFTIDTQPKEWHLDDAMRKLASEIDVMEMVGHGSGHMLIYKLVLLSKADMMSGVDARAMNVTFNPNSNEWIFSDFDRIFELVKNKLGLQALTYDMFGHSAGGQVLHRLVIFHPNSKADRIVAANSGWYTLPTFKKMFPYGLKGTEIPKEQLKASFDDNLVVFLGEEDNADATGGERRRTPEAMKQGVGRFARGKYFFMTAQQEAETLGTTLNWKLVVVPGVGHDFRAMSKAAGEYLYGSKASN